MTRLLPLPFVLLACQGVSGTADAPDSPLDVAVLGQTSPVDAAEDAGGLRRALTLSVSTLIPGDDTTFTVTGANPGETIHFVRSTAGLGAGPCLGTAGLLCLDVLSPKLHATVNADLSGIATLVQTMPLAVPIGADIQFQALAPRGTSGASWVKSAVWETVIEDAPVTVANLASGDLVITEVMQNPDAVSDADGEWFEVRNATGLDANLAGLEVTDFGADSFSVASNLFVPAFGRVIFVRNGDPAVNGGLPDGYDYAGAMSLGNGVDELHLVAGPTIVDSVAWDDGVTFPDPVGASMELDGVYADDAVANDAGIHWLEGIDAYGAGDLGTPAAAGQSTCDPAVEVDHNGQCYYLDGSGTVCAAGYELAPQSVLNDIAGQFVGKDYKSTQSNNCCIAHADQGAENQDWGMPTGHCNTGGPFGAAPELGGSGCTDSLNSNATQLTLCQSL